MLAGGMTACKKKKEVVEATPQGLTRIVEYCAEFKSDDTYIRSNGSGTSENSNIAREKAKTLALGRLSEQLSVVVKGVRDQYLNSRMLGQDEEAVDRFEGLVRTVTNQEIKGAKEVCNELTQENATGNYVYFIALELSGESLVNAYHQALSEDERLRIDYDYEKFKETFEEEMRSLGR